MEDDQINHEEDQHKNDFVDKKNSKNNEITKNVDEIKRENERSVFGCAGYVISGHQIFQHNRG